MPIDSQASAATQLDWRHYDLGRVEQCRMKAPDHVVRFFLALCRHYGLRYAAVDLAVRPDGQWVFLELNPNGLWAWLEQVGGVPIGAALAAELAGDACG